MKDTLSNIHSISLLRKNQKNLVAVWYFCLLQSFTTYLKMGILERIAEIENEVQF